MNICYISNVDISRPNGPGINEREFVRTLQVESELRGDQAFFIIPNPSKRLDFKLRNVEYYQAKSIKLPRFFWFNILSVTWHSSRIILKTLRHFNIDLFVIRLDVNSILIPLLLCLCGQRYSVKTLGDIYNFQSINLNFKWALVMSVLRKSLGMGLRNALLIDVSTAQLYYNYQHKYDLTNIKIIENPVNIELFNIMDKDECKNKCGLKRFGKIVGYCGGNPSRQGARQLVDISPQLISRYPDCGVLIIGDDAELHLVKKKAEQLGINSHIVFTGVIDYKDVSSYINCMDVGVGLHTEEKIRFVGSGSQKVRHYLACGIPIICPKGTNENIVYEGLGMQVETNDLDKLYRSVCCWFDKSVEETEKLRIRSHQFARDNYSTKNIFEQRYLAWKDAMARA